MAVSAKFQADFSSFSEAVDKAQVDLRSFETGAGKVETSLTRMSNSLSGVAIAQQASLMAEAVDRVGGVSALTEKELARVGAVAAEASAKLIALGQDVPPGIQKIADAARGAGNAWTEFIGKVNVKGALSDPIGTAGEAMQAFGETIGPVAVASLGLASGVLAVGAALFELTSKAADAGAKLDDVSNVTGIAVPQLARLSNASTVAGTDLQTLSNAVFMMQKNMGESPDKFERGLQRINLNFADFKALAPDQQLLALSTALKTVEDPVARNAAGFETMGRQFRDIEPALLKLNDALALTADIHPWTEEQAKEAEAFEMQLTSLKVHAEALAIAIGRDMIGPLSSFVGGIKAAASAMADFTGGFGGILTPVFAVREGFSTLSAALAVFLGRAADIPSATGNAARGLAAWQASLKDLQINVPNVNDALQAQKEVISDLDPATKKLIDAYTEINAAGVGWQGTLDQIDGSIVEAVKFYLQAGVSQKVLADAYGLTSTAVKAVATSLAEALQSQKTYDELTVAGYQKRIQGLQAVTQASLQAYGFGAQIAALQSLDAAEQALAKSTFDRLSSEKDRMKVVNDSVQQHITLMNEEMAIQLKQASVVNAAVLAEFDAQVKLNAAWGLDAAGAIRLQKTALDTLSDAMDALHLKKVAGISQEKEEALLMKQYTDALLSEAQAQDAAATSIGKIAPATAAANTQLQAFRGTVILDTTSLQTLNAELTKYYDKLAAQGGVGQLSGTSGVGQARSPGAGSSVAPNFPGYAGGVSDAPGGWSMVGEKGPEAMYVPKGASILPNGPSSGSVHVSISVSGIMDPLTADVMASKVGDAIVRRTGLKLGTN